MDARTERVKVWDPALRLFHWILVVAIAVAFLSAEEESALGDWHVPSGWVAAMLIVFRFVWGFIGGEHSRFTDFIRPSRIPHHIRSLIRRQREPTLGHNPLGAVAVMLLLVLIAITVWTGAFGGEAAEELHELIAWAVLVMVGLHIVAVFVMSRIEGENLVKAMVTGDKPAGRHPGAANARSPGAIAWLMGAVIVGGTGYLIIRYDPDAFAPRTAESYEHRIGVGGRSVDAQSEEAEDD